MEPAFGATSWGEAASGLASFFWSWVAPLSIEAAVLLLAAGLADRLLPRAVWPELRLAVGSALLLKLLLPPFWAPAFELFSWTPPWLPATVAFAVDDSWRGWAIAVAIVWLSGVALLLLLAFWRHRRLEQVWRVAAPPGADLERLLAAASDRFGLRWAPSLRLAAGLASPYVFGAFRPRILLPPGLSGRMAEHALLHELAHIRRGDLFMAGGLGLLRILYFFHPLVHLAARRLAGLRELCCDRFVARRLGEERAAYRQTLLAFAAAPSLSAFGRSRPLSPPRGRSPSPRRRG